MVIATYNYIVNGECINIFNSSRKIDSSFEDVIPNFNFEPSVAAVVESF